MKKKKETVSENYLEKVPVRPEWIPWSADENGIVTLDIENKGFMNTVAQKLFKKPRFSHIHLDEIGSFVWPMVDGQTNIVTLGVMVEEQFGEKAAPLYPRLAKFFQVLDSYHFIEWK